LVLLLAAGRLLALGGRLGRVAVGVLPLADAERLGEQDAALTWTTGTTGEVVKPEPQATGAADQPVTSLAPADSGPDAQPPTPEESREFAPDAPTKKGRK
jgi:hypothetical protein